jgi:hypothetical protein
VTCFSSDPLDAVAALHAEALVPVKCALPFGREYSSTREHVFAGGKKVRDEDVSALAQMMKDGAFDRMKTLCLSVNQVGDSAARALGQILKSNTSLQSLNLHDNVIGDAGACALGEGLKQNYRLQVLDVGRNTIGDDGAIGLGRALRCQTSLKELNLSCNQVGDQGACALGHGLQSNCLKILNLSFNQIGDAGAIGLGQGLQLNSSLQELNLAGNMLSVVGVSRIISCVLHNDEVADLYFDHPFSSCCDHVAWMSEGLAVPPQEVVRKGWRAILPFLRRQKNVCGTMCLVLNAAAACPVFCRRSVRAHYLQPSARLWAGLTQRSLESASWQQRSVCCDIKSRLRLLCCCCPLSFLAFRLARAVGIPVCHLFFYLIE